MKESPDLKAWALRFYDALVAGDAKTCEQMVSTGEETLAIGTDPDEYWRGDKVRDALRMQLEASGGFPLKASDPVAYEEGDIGWFADNGTMQGPDGEARFRVTGVAHRENGEWKLVQMHGSFPVSNEEALGQELPT